MKVDDGEWQQMEPRNTAETCKTWARAYARTFVGMETLRFRIYDPLGRCIFWAVFAPLSSKMRWERGDYLTRDGGAGMMEIPKSQSARRAKREPKPEKRRAHNSTLAAPTKPMNKINPVRVAAARAEDFAWQADACERLPCFACGREGASVAHHEPPRKRGGTDCDTIPLCDLTRLGGVPGCHQRRHDKGELTFWSALGCTPEEAKEHVRVQAGLLPPLEP